MRISNPLWSQKQKLKTHRRGVAAIEFTILLPVLAFLFLVALDFAQIYNGALVAADCSGQAAIHASQTSDSGTRDELSYASTARASVWR